MGQREVTPGGPLERSPPKGNDDNILSPRRRPRWAPARCPRQGPPASLRRGFLPNDPRLLLNNNISSPLCFEPQVAPAAPRIKSKPLTRALVTRPPIFSLALGSLVCPPSGPQVPAGPLLLHAVPLTPGLVPRGGAGETSREGAAPQHQLVLVHRGALSRGQGTGRKRDDVTSIPGRGLHLAETLSRGPQHPELLEAGSPSLNPVSTSCPCSSTGFIPRRLTARTPLTPG